MNTKCLMAIDDLADRKHNVDILLDQNSKGELSTTNPYVGLIDPACNSFWVLNMLFLARNMEKPGIALNQGVDPVTY